MTWLKIKLSHNNKMELGKRKGIIDCHYFFLNQNLTLQKKRRNNKLHVKYSNNFSFILVL